MRVAVPKEIKEGEKRVALVPDVINKLTRLGLDVVIEAGAGTHSQATDADFTTAGATVKQGDVLADADVVLSVQPLTAQQMATLKKGAITISFLSPVTAVDSIDAAAAAGVAAFDVGPGRCGPVTSRSRLFREIPRFLGSCGLLGAFQGRPMRLHPQPA